MFTALMAAMIWQLNQPIVYAREIPTKEKVMQTIRYVFPSSVEEKMIIIARCESDFQPIQSYALNKDGTQEKSFGIFQINIDAHPEYKKEELLSSYEYNIKAAYEVWMKEGLKAWLDCSKDNKLL